MISSFGTTHFLKVRDQVVKIADLAKFHSEIKYDIRYARADNFIKKAVYHQAQAFLLEHVAEDLVKVHEQLKKQGFGLLIYDGYRPWAVTKLFWDLSSEQDRQFLADPAKGSSHNRGCAVDLSMFDLTSGSPVVMPSDFDEMNEKAYVEYMGGDEKARQLRELLQVTMRQHGFTGIKNEWWHFNHVSHHDWPVMNFTFEEILSAPAR